MNGHDLSRRSLLHAIATMVGTVTLPWGWAEITRAAQDAHASAQHGHGLELSFFTPADAADVEAVAAHIIPTDDTPGAREAGVVYFIDRALATFLSQLAADYRVRLAEFQGLFRERRRDAPSFATLSFAQQLEYLTAVDDTPFFDTTRLLTLLGMFSLPAYGGNRDGVGWKLLGFEDRHAFQPPFGYYDRDYQGFAPVQVRKS